MIRCFVHVLVSMLSLPTTTMFRVALPGSSFIFPYKGDNGTVGGNDTGTLRTARISQTRKFDGKSMHMFWKRQHSANHSLVETLSANVTSPLGISTALDSPRHVLEVANDSQGDLVQVADSGQEYHVKPGNRARVPIRGSNTSQLMGTTEKADNRGNRSAAATQVSWMEEVKKGLNEIVSAINNHLPQEAKRLDPFDSIPDRLKVRIMEFITARSCSPIIRQFIKDLPEKLDQAYPEIALGTFRNAMRVNWNFNYQFWAGFFTRSRASQEDVDNAIGQRRLDEYIPEQAVQVQNGTAQRAMQQFGQQCHKEADEVAASFHGIVPEFVNAAGWFAGDVASRLRMRQATVAAMLRIVLEKTAGIHKLSMRQRHRVYYRAYTDLSGTGAGVYYGTGYGQDDDVHRMAQHAKNISQRSKHTSKAYRRGIEFEKARGVFRTWNALESKLLYMCFDKIQLCPPWFAPATLGTLTDADLWALNYAYARSNFGEALWLPHHQRENGGPTVWCAASHQFVPNSDFNESYS